MKKIIFILLLPTSLLANEGNGLLDFSLEDLMNVKVVTASKSEQSVMEATSIVSVITRNDIENSGLLTVYDLLKRVPGFFPSQQATWSLMTSRGLTTSGNDHFLFLIDGHPQNSIIGQGYQQQDLLPNLDQIEQIEIMRGPGSVLWGSNAVMGIINVITRRHLERPQVNIAAQTGGGPQYANFMEGVGDGEKIKGFYSLTTWMANGYTHEDGAKAFPWGTEGNGFREWPSVNKQREGFDLYTKVNIDSKTEVIGRILKTSFNYVWDELGGSGSKHELANRRAYLNIKRFLNVNEDLKLTVNVFGDYNLQNRGAEELYVKGYPARSQDQTNEEFAAGGELTATLKVSPENTLLMGLRAVRTKIGPNRDARLDPVSNTPVNSGGDTDSQGNPFTFNVPYYGVEPGIDHTSAIYLEDTHRFGNTLVFGGARLDMNDYRDQTTVVLPRLGIIQTISPRVKGKYIFSTGYLRSPAVYSKTVGMIVDTSRGGAFPIARVEKSEQVQSHDLQLSYSSSTSYAAITFFYMHIRDFSSFDAVNNTQGYKNIGDASTHGIEFEGKHKVLQALELYGNLSYTRGHIHNDYGVFEGVVGDSRGRTLNYPLVISNLGTTWTQNDKYSWNLNLLGWHDMRYIKAKDQSGKYGNIDYNFNIDNNFIVKNFLIKDLNFNAFVWNVLDNQERIGMVVNNGTFRPPGRALGGRFNYEF